MKKWSSIIIQTVIGILLLWICMWYVEHHPAEKIWILASVSFLQEKISSMSKLRNGRSDKEIDELGKYKMSFSELKSVVKSKACEQALKAGQINTNTIDQIIQTLESTTASEFETNKTKYITVFNTINDNIKNYCK